MNIREFRDSDKENFEKFETYEWALEDKKHFGTSEIDFKKREFFYIIEENSSIIGYIKFSGHTGVCRVSTLIIAKGYRNRGIGKKLMSLVEDICRKHNYHKIWLETGIGWGAEKFYEDIGFKKLATFKNHFGHKDFTIFEKFIA